MSFVRNLAAGAAAGAVGTAAMDSFLYRRYRRGGGTDSPWDWEFATTVTTWDQASAPGQVGLKAEHVLLRHQPPDSWARATTNIVHWATGIGWCIQYGALADRTARHPVLRAIGLGPAVWLSGYVLLPPLKVYKPIWKYDATTLAKDLSGHLVFGAAASTTFALLQGNRTTA
jgi:hypothetical protein